MTTTANPIISFCMRCHEQEQIGFASPQVGWGLHWCDPCWKARKLESQILKLGYMLKKTDASDLRVLRWERLLQEAKLALADLPTPLPGYSA